jgi:hypothetical protein
LDPRGELPSPPFSSLSLFLSLPFPSLHAPSFFSPARMPPAALARGPLRPSAARPSARRPWPPHDAMAPGPPRDGPALPRGGPLLPRRRGLRPPPRRPRPPAARPSPCSPAADSPPPWRGSLASPRRGPGPLRVAPSSQRRGSGPSARRPDPRRRGSLTPSRVALRPLHAAIPARCVAPALGSMDPRRGPCARVGATSRSPVYPTRPRMRSPTHTVIYSCSF